MFPLLDVSDLKNNGKLFVDNIRRLHYTRTAVLGGLFASKLLLLD